MVDAGNPVDDLNAKAEEPVDELQQMVALEPADELEQMVVDEEAKDVHMENESEDKMDEKLADRTLALTLN